MPCYRPVTVWKPDDGGSISFRELKNHREVKIKCGRCIGCRIDKQNAWAFRCYAESKMHKHNSFITLTYDDQHLPNDLSLDHREWQLFAKKLRHKTGPFRFFMCGEYGENTFRPHYHALLFGVEFPDRVKSNSVYSAHDIYDSEMLREVWGKGHVSIGEVTYASARYVASYTLKSSDNPEYLASKYSRLNTETGELYQVEPQYGRMSLKPGIGATWFEKYWPEVATHGGVFHYNRKLKIPEYFDTIFEKIAPDDFDASKMSRSQEAEKYIDNNTRERLEVREACAKAKQKFYKESTNHAL